MSFCLISNVNGQYMLDIIIKDYDKLTSIKGQSLYPVISIKGKVEVDVSF